MLSRRTVIQRANPSPEGVMLGRRLLGEPMLPVDRDGSLVLPFELMGRHVVVLGASGSGKTETAMRIAYEVARKLAAPVFYLDAKGDRQAAERFSALMAAAGRRVRVFPNQRFDAWRGDWRAIVNRLLEVIAFVPEGPAAFYRDLAKTALQLACNHPDGPPRCSAELLGRLDYEMLLNAHGPTTTVLSLPRDKVAQIRMRYEAFFGQMGSLLDGEWSFEDVDAAYFLLDSVALGEDTCGAASLLFADFAHFFAQRKPRDRFCVFFADEFAAIASSSDIAMKVEQARGFNTALILVPQTVSGMGEPSQRDRILGSIETVIAHAVNEPGRLAELAGSRPAIELTHRFEAGARVPEGLARVEMRPRLEADRIRELGVGEAWVIRRGRAAKVAVRAAPGGSRRPLPTPEAIDQPLERLEVTLPKELDYLGEES